MKTQSRQQIQGDSVDHLSLEQERVGLMPGRQRLMMCRRYLSFEGGSFCVWVCGSHG